MKTLCIIMLSLSTMSAVAAGLPRPANDQMSTEYISEKKMKFVKKPIISSGRIIMYNKDELVYTQDEPAVFVVTKTEKTVTYQRDNMSPMRFDLSDSSSSGGHYLDIIALFGDDEQVSNHYNIAAADSDGASHYIITPKEQSNIREMRALAVGDKLSSLIIFYNDGSVLKYTFRNTVTGVRPPDYEKYFK